jgi:glycosyltransferase involved in cell wall biosynthesis
MSKIKRLRSFVSVVMPIRNAEAFVDAAVGSILSQSFEKLELICVDDGSTDRSVDLIRRFVDPRIRVLVSQGRGMAAALNTALGEARGDLIARMDADDVAHSLRLERQVEFLYDNPDIILCGTEVETFGTEHGRLMMPLDSKDIRATLIFGTPFIHPTVMFRRSLIDQGYLYNEAFELAQDYEFWARVVPQFKSANLPQVLLKMRRRASHSCGSDYRQRQQEFAHLARKALFDGLGVDLTPEQNDAYKKLAAQDFRLSKDEFRDCVSWAKHVLNHFPLEYTSRDALRKLLMARLYWAFSEAVTPATLKLALNGLKDIGGGSDLKFQLRSLGLAKNAAKNALRRS